MIIIGKNEVEIKRYDESISKRSLSFTLLDPGTWRVEPFYELVRSVCGTRLQKLEYDHVFNLNGQTKQTYNMYFHCTESTNNRSEINHLMTQVEAMIEYLLPAKIYNKGHRLSDNHGSPQLRKFLRTKFDKKVKNSGTV